MSVAAADVVASSSVLGAWVNMLLPNRSHYIVLPTCYAAIAAIVAAAAASAAMAAVVTTAAQVAAIAAITAIIAAAISTIATVTTAPTAAIAARIRFAIIFLIVGVAFI